MRGENRNHDVAFGALQNADIIRDVRQEIAGLVENAEARALRYLGRRELYTWPRSIWSIRSLDFLLTAWPRSSISSSLPMSRGEESPNGVFPSRWNWSREGAAAIALNQASPVKTARVFLRP